MSHTSSHHHLIIIRRFSEERFWCEICACLSNWQTLLCFRCQIHAPSLSVLIVPVSAFAFAFIVSKRLLGDIAHNAMSVTPNSHGSVTIFVPLFCFFLLSVSYSRSSSFFFLHMALKSGLFSIHGFPLRSDCFRFSFLSSSFSLLFHPPTNERKRTAVYRRRITPLQLLKKFFSVLYQNGLASCARADV